MRGKVLFDFEVGVDLSVEREGPCEKVDPADHVNDCLLSLVDFVQHKILNDRFIIKFRISLK